MASNLRVDSIVPATSGNVSIGTATGGVTIPGNLGISGVLTYEDVTNIDSIGIITARSTVSIADSIVHTGDTNTSLRFPASDTISAETLGSERLRITSDGDLLIGSTTNGGGNRLYVVDNFTDAFVNPSDSILRIENANTSGTTGQASISFTSKTSGSNADSAIVSQAEDASGNARLEFWTDTSNGMTEKMTITSQGYVTKPTQPSFTARSTGTWTHGSSTGYLDIDINMNEEFDVGGNYNGQIFTAPVAGKYFFSYTFQYQCTSGYLVVSLRKGVSGSYSQYGNMMMYPPQQSTTYHGPGIIGIMDLAAGNTVKPVAEVNYPGNQIANVNFSGYLLG